ncbi:MAG: YgiT-type zinc finger protein [Chitinivibrionales bacterium]|nr:YgiT-type zinc finger protein [Chitinivibrionales bacterium]
MINKISSCPTCGSNKIKKIKRDYSDEYNGKNYIIPDLEFEECPDCGEQLFDREALRKMEKFSPAFKHKKAA